MVQWLYAPKNALSNVSLFALFKTTFVLIHKHTLPGCGFAITIGGMQKMPRKVLLFAGLIAMLIFSLFSPQPAAAQAQGLQYQVQEGDTLKIVKTSNADTPLAHRQTALLTCDVWEHAYYLDYQNRRKDFVQAFLDHLANWDFAASQLQ